MPAAMLQQEQTGHRSVPGLEPAKQWELTRLRPRHGQRHRHQCPRCCRQGLDDVLAIVRKRTGSYWPALVVVRSPQQAWCPAGDHYRRTASGIDDAIGVAVP